MARSTEFLDLSPFPHMRTKVISNRNASSIGTNKVSAGQQGLLCKFGFLMENGKRQHTLVQFEDSNGKFFITNSDNISCAANFPFQARKSQVAKNGWLALNIGDYGVVRAAYPDQGHAYVFKSKTREQGYVALDAIDIGIEREHGHYIVEQIATREANPDTKPLDKTSIDRSSDVPVARTMKQFLDTVWSSRDKLEHVAHWFWPLVDTDTKRDKIVESAIRGFKAAGTYELLKNGDFTLDKLVKHASNAAKSDATGIYLRLYLLEKKRRSAQYIGSANEIKQRMWAHEHDLPTSKGAHAIAYGKKVEECSCSVLCKLENGGQSEHGDEVKFVIEQLVVVVFGSYDEPRINGTNARLNTSPQSYQDNDLEEAANALAEMQDIDDIAVPDQTGRQNDERRAMKNFVLANAAKTSAALANIAREVHKKCKWNPPTTRSHGRFGTVTGLNYMSPIDAIANTQILTKFQTSEMTIYRKPPRRIKRYVGAYLIGGIGSHGSKFTDHWAIRTDSRELKVGLTVTMVIEVTRDGQQHPNAYARLPNIRCWEDSSRVMSVGIRLEWEDDSSRHHSVYLKASHKLGFLTETPGDILYAHSMIVGLLNMLENLEITQNKRYAVPYFRKYTMYEIAVDHLRQKITAQQINSQSPRKVKDAGLRPTNVVNQELVNAGAEKMGSPRGTTLRSKKKRGGSPRSLCDRCFAAAKFKDKRPRDHGSVFTAFTMDRWLKCEEGSGNSCKNCEIFGHDCSFTADVMDMPALLQALWFPPMSATDAFDLVDPEVIDQHSWEGVVPTQSHSRQGSMGRQGQISRQASPTHSRGSSPGSPTTGSRIRAESTSLNIPPPRLRWARPVGSLRKDVIKDAHRYNEDNFFKGELPAAAKSLDNRAFITQTAAQIANTTYPLFQAYAHATRTYPSGSDERATAGEAMNSAFNSLGVMFDIVRSRNLLDAADALAQLAFNEFKLDLWELNAPNAAAPTTGPQPWQKPHSSVRKNAHALATDYFEDTFKGKVPHDQQEGQLAKEPAATIIDQTLYPVLEQCRRAFNDPKSSEADKQNARDAATRIFRILGRLYLVTKATNVLDAADWLAQHLSLEFGVDIWEGNDEQGLRNRGRF